ncbi:MAG: nucleotidyltransferase domain-containing protein [Nanoarchaeota archaeon]
MKRESLIAYAMSFVSYLFDKELSKKINKVILFGSIARGDFDNNSDIDLFIDVSDKLEKEFMKELSIFEKTETHKKWVLKGLKQHLSLKLGSIGQWNSLKRSLISDGILLYGKFEQTPDEAKQYSLFELKFDKLARNKKVILWRKLYGHNQKVNGKLYTTQGKVFELGGKRLERGIVVPAEKMREAMDFFENEKIKYTIRDIWSDGI